jgi:hypothetical protein
MKKRKVPPQQSNIDGGIDSPAIVVHKRNKMLRPQPADPEHPPRIPIDTPDHDRVLALLQMIDWDKAINTSRKNVIRSEDPSTPRIKRNRGEQPYCRSFIFGRNMKDPSAALSWWSTQYPHIYQELQRLMQKYNPTFSYTHITLNKNLHCKRHTDGGNAGPSYIIGLGNYTGGSLQIESADGAKMQQQDLHSTFVLFNGKTQPHETLPFTGDRYTLVYYTSDMVPKECSIQSPLNENAPTSSALHPISGSIPSTSATSASVSASIAAKFQSIKNKLGRKRS